MALKRRPPAHNVRRVKTNGRNTWGSTTNQQHETVQFESDLARRLFYALLRKSGVVRIVSEPMVIPFVDSNGIMRTYVPDYKVIFGNGQVEIHEFSMSDARLRNEIRERERGAREYLKTLCWDYIVHTEIDLPSPTEYANLRAIRKYAPTAYDNPVIFRAAKAMLILHAGKKVSICEIADQVSTNLRISKSWVYSTIWYSIWHNRLAYDPDILLFLDGTPNPAAVVWVAQVDNSK